ncbi:MAG: hypothetical protein JKY03_04805 [Aureispira sp.]|nr:hypothetical protein [Aureispira sp.]
MIKFYQVLGLVIAIVLSGCIKDSNPSRPAYVYIENVFFEADTMLGEGSSSSNITDVWVSVDGQQLGANTMPALFPVILDDNFPTNSVRISAGIKDNGITNTRTIYPFYDSYIETIDLEAGRIDTFRPTLHYPANANVILVEDFENPNQPIFTDDKDGNPNTEMVAQMDDVFEGNYSGSVVLDSANLDCTVATSVRYYNLRGLSATAVYLEMDFKTNTTFHVGIIAHYGSSDTETLYKGGVNPSTSWKKIYFNLTADVYGSNATEYSVIIRALKDVDVADPQIYVDNIKLVHF